MNVDGASGEPCTRVVRQHLHVPGEHDEVDVVRVDEIEQRAFGLGLGGCGHRHMMERDPRRFDEWSQIVVVRDHGRNLDVEGAGARPEHQVVQAVAEP